jgi:hypothetical protein
MKMLSSVAKETGAWVLGGERAAHVVVVASHSSIGSIPERDSEGKLYNTSTVYSPKVGGTELLQTIG